MKEIEKVNPDSSRDTLGKASNVLFKGGIIAFPTETFYGLGVNAFNEDAIKKVFQVKKRERGKPLLLLISSEDQLSQLTPDINEVAQKLIDTFWPGPLSLLFKASSNIPKALMGGSGKIGARISGNITARKLCQITGFPITGSSANISNERESDSAKKVFEIFGDKIDMILDGGKTPGGKSSTIVDVSESVPKLIRQGAIEKEEIEEILQQKF